MAMHGPDRADSEPPARWRRWPGPRDFEVGEGQHEAAVPNALAAVLNALEAVDDMQSEAAAPNALEEGQGNGKGKGKGKVLGEKGKGEKGEGKNKP